MVNVSDATLLHVQGIRPHIDSTVSSITPLNTSLATISSELDSGPNGLFRETTITDKP